MNNENAVCVYIYTYCIFVWKLFNCDRKAINDVFDSDNHFVFYAIRESKSASQQGKLSAC